MATNMKENGFETMIVKYLVENNHYEEGSNSDYNKIYAIDEVRLFRFLHDTQYEKLAELRIEDNEIEKKKFLDRLSKKISDDGVINIIRKGMKYKNKTVDFYMVRPSEGNQEAKESYDKNIFSVTRQLRYSNDYGRLALDVCIFLNGLPIITMELKNQITKQNHDDAIRQYMTDRTPDELLFQFKRCIVHFAVDDDEIYMCTELKKEKSFFMPFNKGNNNGAGNPRNPNGLKTDYLWKDILTKPCLSNILENYVQITEEKDEDTGRKSYKQIFPRYHQLSVVTSLLADAKNDGPGHRYLIQHSAGSGKSNSIAWLAHQLVTLKKDKKDVFDTVIVVTDRVNLDKQIRDTIKQFMQVSSTVGWAKDASTLSTLMEQGKKIIITIVHKFQFILDAVSADYKNKKFAIIIDEAHSSQNGSLAAKMNIAVSGNVYDDDDEFEDKLNTIIEGKKMAPNASYFAFTATPKNKTLEMFGKKMFDEHGNPILNDDGTQKANPHYVYTMKQAIETLLREHYRCHPKIINFCNQKFYRGELIIMTTDKGEEDVLSVVKTVAGNHERNHYSQRQIDVIKNEIIPKYVSNPEETGIIAPYKNQVEALSKEITDIDAATVHKFQGKEKEDIIISIVDDEISDFADDPYLINVAVSRAKKKLMLVVTGNVQSKEHNITDLIDYIQYNNFEVTESKIYSIFDYLYKQYTEERRVYLQKHKKVSEYDSENLMYSLIEDIISANNYSSLDVVCHFPLNMLIKNPKLLNEQECQYAMNPATHLDFLIYNRIGKKPVLAIEVDGYEYHKEDTIQASRDLLKNHIMELYEIPLLRFKTNGSGEREKIVEMLDKLV